MSSSGAPLTNLEANVWVNLHTNQGPQEAWWNSNDWYVVRGLKPTGLKRSPNRHQERKSSDEQDGSRRYQTIETLEWPTVKYTELLKSQY